MSRRLAVLLSAAVLGCVAAAAPAQSQDQIPQPAYSSSVDIVSVDVNVVDHKGQPIRDLGREDFTLMVDGRVRKIQSAQFISVEAAKAAPGPAVPTPSFSTNGAPPGRMIALVVDRGSITPVRSRDIFTAAARFVHELDPGDLVALYTIPTGPTIDFTTDHPSIEAALGHIDGQGDFQRGTMGLGVAEALAFEKNNTIMMDQTIERVCGKRSEVSGPGISGNSEVLMCTKMVKEESSIIATYAHERARNTINGLRAILERLGSSETPKTMMLVSEGIVVENERRILEGFGRAAAAAHVTLYALKPEPSETDASQARMPAMRSQDRAAREEGLQYVSAVGGGELFRVLADPDFAFARVRSELSGYYLLGFEPESGDRDGKSHQISVKVRRDDVVVRSRREFGVGLIHAKPGKEGITDLLVTPVLETGIPLTLTTYVFQDPGSLRVRLLVAMDIDRAIAPTGQVSIGLVLLDEKGAAGASLFQPTVPSAVSPLGIQRYFATLLVDPGPSRFALPCRTRADGGAASNGRCGRHMRRLSQFRVTELLIGDDGSGDSGRGSGAEGILPSVTGEMSAGVLHAYSSSSAKRRRRSTARRLPSKWRPHPTHRHSSPRPRGSRRPTPTITVAPPRPPSPSRSFRPVRTLPVP